MTEALRRYKVILIILGLIVCIAAFWIIFARQNANKIPLRGVFVIQPASYNAAGWIIAHKTVNSVQNI